MLASSSTLNYKQIDVEFHTVSTMNMFTQNYGSTQYIHYHAGSSVNSTNIQFNKFHWSNIITRINTITTNARFNIVSGGLGQLFTEPRGGHPGWVAQLTAGRRPTTLTIPECVIKIESTYSIWRRVPTHRRSHLPQRKEFVLQLMNG